MMYGNCCAQMFCDYLHRVGGLCAHKVESFFCEVLGRCARDLIVTCAHCFDVSHIC